MKEKHYLDKYEVGTKISEDQISKTYLAYDKRSGEKFVIRFFEFQESDTDLIEAFNSELSLISTFDHPKLVKLHKLDSEKSYCSIRKHLNGRSLYALSSSKKYDAPQELVVKIIFDICDVIKYIHEMGSIHGFLSPSNIILENDQINVINQDNYALLKNTQPTIYQILYFSPEQIKGEVLDQRTDIYAIGIMLYKLFTGKSLYSTDVTLGLTNIADFILNSTPTMPSLYNLDISSELENIILKATAKNKEDRYLSIQELENDLKKYFKNISYKDYDLFGIFEKITSVDAPIYNTSNEIVINLKVEENIDSNKNKEIKTFSWIKDITNDFSTIKIENFDEIEQRFNDDISGLLISDNNHYIPLYKNLPLVCLDHSKSDFSNNITLKNIMNSSKEIELRTFSEGNEEISILIHNILSPSYDIEFFMTTNDFYEKKKNFTGVIKFDSNIKKIRLLNLEKDLLFSTMMDSFFENKYESKNITDKNEFKNCITSENFNIVIYDLDFHNDIEPYIAEMWTIIFIATGKRSDILEAKNNCLGKFKNLFFIEKSLSSEYFNNIEAFMSKVLAKSQNKEYTYYFAYLNGNKKFTLQSSKESGKTNTINLDKDLLLNATEIKVFDLSIKTSIFCVSSILQNTDITVSYKRDSEYTMDNLLSGIVLNDNKNILGVKKNLLTETEHNLNFYFSTSKNIMNAGFNKFPDWILDNYFPEISSKKTGSKAIMENITSIKKETFFEYVEKYGFDVVLNSSFGYLTVASFGIENEMEKNSVVSLGTQLLLNSEEFMQSFDSSTRVSSFLISNTNSEINTNFNMRPLSNITDVNENLIAKTERNLNLYFSVSKNILNSAYYRFADWVLNSYFFETFLLGKEHTHTNIMHNISKIKKVTFFEYVEKYIFDVVFHSSSEDLVVACFGSENSPNLLKFIEKVKESNNKSTTKIKSAFYVSLEAYSSATINSYKDITDSNGFVKTPLEENAFQVILVERKDMVFQVFEILKSEFDHNIVNDFCMKENQSASP